ncbi:hypothetical protein M569_05162, partial [Genlisea aurea]
DSNCSVQISQFMSDTIEAENLNLLVGTSYVDSILTVLPVLSEEEQYAIASTPAHPTALLALYASCLAGNLAEELWNFAWPAAVALIYPSLLPVAVLSFCSQLVVIVGGPLVGKLMDHFPRVAAVNCLAFIQVVSQVLSVGMISIAHRTHPTSISSVLGESWFIVLVLFLAVEKLSGLAQGVAFERDWIVLLAGINRPIALAQANAILQRIELLCEIGGASLFGFLLSNYEPIKCLKLAAGFMIISLPIAVLLSLLTNKLSSGALGLAKCSQSGSGCSCEVAIPDTENIFSRSIEAIKLGWVEYSQQPVLPASLACVLLYFNVVLAPSALMTAFLTQRGLNPSIIGGFSGLCAAMGIAATFVSAEMVKRLGLLKAGAAGLIFQASSLAVAVIVYWRGSISSQQKSPLLMFLWLIIISRLGKMSYDAVGAQILQTGIPESKANLIGTTEVSLCSLAESLMLGIAAVIANDASHFGILVMLSLGSVVGAACLYCMWLRN